MIWKGKNRKKQKRKWKGRIRRKRKKEVEKKEMENDKSCVSGYCYLRPESGGCSNFLQG